MQTQKPAEDTFRPRLFGQSPALNATAVVDQSASELESEGAIWTPVATTASRPPAVVIPNELALLATCTARISSEDGHRVGNDKKEQQLARLFEALTSTEAYSLHKRLANPRGDDELATAFAQRLTIERRTRLLAYLGSPKRRAGLRR